MKQIEELESKFKKENIHSAIPMKNKIYMFLDVVLRLFCYKTIRGTY